MSSAKLSQAFDYAMQDGSFTQAALIIKDGKLVGLIDPGIYFGHNEMEIAYFGLLEEYHNKKLGSYLLSDAIKKSFQENVDRVWLHTCSLDHKNALNNYLSRGMKIFKSEIVKI